MNQVLGTTFFICVFHSNLSVVNTKKEFCTVEWQQMALGSLSPTKSLQNHPYTTLQLIAPTFLPSNYAKKVHLLDTFYKDMVITQIVKPEETVHKVEIRAEL